MNTVRDMVSKGANIKDCKNTNNDTVLHRLVRQYLPAIISVTYNRARAEAFLEGIEYLKENAVDIHAKNTRPGISAYQMLLNAPFCINIAFVASLLISFPGSNQEERNNAGFTLLELALDYEKSHQLNRENSRRLLDIIKFLNSTPSETRHLEVIYKIDPDDLVDQKDLNLAWDYRHDPVLGKGKTGEVYFTQLHTEEVALKKISLEDSAYTALLKQSCTEIAFLQMLGKIQVPNVIAFRGYRIEKDAVYIFMEYAAFASLKAYMDKNGKPDWEDASGPGLPSQLAKDVITGMYWVDAFDILLCDLKPDNVVLVRDSGSPHQICAKLIDFDLSMEVKNANACPCAGTPWFMAPEIQDNPLTKNNTRESDIYSYGRLLLAIAQWEPYPSLAGQFPCDYRGRWDLFKKVLNKNLAPDIPLDTPREIQTMIRQATAANPKDRPSASMLRSEMHSFFVRKTSLLSSEKELYSYCNIL